MLGHVHPWSSVPLGIVANLGRLQVVLGYLRHAVAHHVAWVGESGRGAFVHRAEDDLAVRGLLFRRSILFDASGLQRPTRLLLQHIAKINRQMNVSRREIFLDLMRGCAALLVCANHLRAATMESYQSLTFTSLLLQAFYAITSFGHQAVIVFFVLSGYFVGGSLLAKRAVFSWREYGIARLSRLWMVLIPALLLTFALDQILLMSAPEVLSGTYANLWHLGPQPGGEYSVGIGVFIGNLLFLQQIFLPVFGSNDPLWSLAYEFWYYSAFPLLLAGIERGENSYGIVHRCLALAAAATILVCLPTSGRIGFLCWLGGVAVHAFRGRYSLARVPLPLSLVVFVAGVGLSRWLGKGGEAAVGDLSMALITMFLLVSLDSRSRAVSLWRPVSRMAFHLSEMSYSLYLTHFPFVLLIGGIVLRGHRLQPNAAGFAIYLGWLCALLALAWCFWFIFERRTHQLRQALLQVLARRAG